MLQCKIRAELSAWQTQALILGGSLNAKRELGLKKGAKLLESQPLPRATGVPQRRRHSAGIRLASAQSPCRPSRAATSRGRSTDMEASAKPCSTMEALISRPPAMQRPSPRRNPSYPSIRQDTSWPCSKAASPAAAAAPQSARAASLPQASPRAGAAMPESRIMRSPRPRVSPSKIRICDASAVMGRSAGAEPNRLEGKPNPRNKADTTAQASPSPEPPKRRLNFRPLKIRLGSRTEIV